MSTWTGLLLASVGVAVFVLSSRGGVFFVGELVDKWLGPSSILTGRIGIVSVFVMQIEQFVSLMKGDWVP